MVSDSFSSAVIFSNAVLMGSLLKHVGAAMTGHWGTKRMGISRLTAGDAGGAGSEDCLNVNIYAPVNATKDSKCEYSLYIHFPGHVFSEERPSPYACAKR